MTEYKIFVIWSTSNRTIEGIKTMKHEIEQLINEIDKLSEIQSSCERREAWWHQNSSPRSSKSHCSGKGLYLLASKGALCVESCAIECAH